LPPGEKRANAAGAKLTQRIAVPPREEAGRHCGVAAVRPGRSPCAKRETVTAGQQWMGDCASSCLWQLGDEAINILGLNDALGAQLVDFQLPGFDKAVKEIVAASKQFAATLRGIQGINAMCSRPLLEGFHNPLHR
jgi:hypothetical protein